MTVDASEFAKAAEAEIRKAVIATPDKIDGILEGGAKFALNALRADNDRSEANKHPSVRKGDYAASWTLSKTGKRAKGFKVGNYTVYNKEYYRLTHILEDGAIREDNGIVKGDGHITKIDEMMKKNVETKLGGI